jgi:uncharacterized protein with HEPN domain
VKLGARCPESSRSNTRRSRGADIVGMRHKVVHDYLGVDEDIVWQVVTEDLPTLVRALEPIVPPAPPVTNVQ